MSKNAFFLSIMMVYSMGCTTSDGPATADLGTVVPASAQSAETVPGLVAWQIQQTADGIEVNGVDNQGRMLTRTTIHSETIDSAGTRKVEIASDSATLRLTSRDDQILSHEMVGQPSAATAQLMRDLRDYDGVQPYGCLVALLTAAGDCTIASLEGGANIFADVLCIGALANYVNECLF